MNSATTDQIWALKYRPQTVKDLILNPNILSHLQSWIEDSDHPHLIFAGLAGTGKTSAAKVLAQAVAHDDYLFLNGSLEGGIDTLRGMIQDYATSVSLHGSSRRYIVLDEADQLSSSMMMALRGFLEQYSQARFILTCNYISKIIEPIQSRCTVVTFAPKLSVEGPLIVNRLIQILQAEGKKYKPEVVAAIVKKYFPDMRRMLNILQTHGASDVSGLISNINAEVEQFWKHIVDGDFRSARTWIGESPIATDAEIFTLLFGLAEKNLENGDKLLRAVITIGQYQQYYGLVPDRQLNLAACAAELIQIIR